jgi:MoaA/NifB/PqqE/SkfB family radical SAM enzyme
MCFEGKNEKKKVFMDIDMVRDIAKQMSGKRSLVFITGGEPFTHPGIWDIIKTFNERGILTSVCTNGTLIKKDDIEKLEMANSLMISVHGTKETHDDVTGNKGSFDKIMDTLDTINEKDIKTPIIINTAILPSNLGELKNIIKIFTAKKVAAIRLQHTNFLTPNELSCHQRIFSGQDHNPNVYIENKSPIDPQNLIQKIKVIKNEKHDIPIFFVPDLEYEEIKDWYSPEFNIKRKCLFVFREVFIDQEGEVSSCRTLRYKFGDLKKNHLKDILGSQEAKNFRSKIKKGMPPGCNRCCRL